MLDIGIDWQALNQSPNIMVLPTRYVESMVPLVDRVVDLAVNDAFAAAENPPSAALFYHRPQRQSFASFDALGPFASHAQLVTQSAADGAATRQPYVAALVGSDPTHRARRRRVRAAWTGRRGAQVANHAASRCQPAVPTNTRRGQNVTVRTYDDHGQTVCVVVNECPWQADVSLEVVASRPTEASPLVIVKDSTVQPAAEHFNAGRQIWSLATCPLRRACRAVRHGGRDD